MILTLLLLTGFSSVLVGLFSTFFGFTGSLVIIFGTLFSSLLISFYYLYLFICYAEIQSFLISTSTSWILTPTFDIQWNFLYDPLNSVMVTLVLFISFLIHLYSLDYMSKDPHIVRFLVYLSFFTFFMIFFISAANLLQMFLGWEGVGLSSYLLINFWYTRLQANKASLKAVFLNRIGDLGILGGIFFILIYLHNVNYLYIFAELDKLNKFYLIYTNFNIKIHVLSLIVLLFFLGAIAKSAQIGLHAWLPDAMEGPTPVSALLHSATMVTAGVFLLIRLSPLLEYAHQNVLFFISMIGGITSFVAASIGLFQMDLKRIIAYSTCSQLGYMVLICGLSHYHVGMFHIVNHAFFKALLFLCSGSIIHALADEQDIRKMGGLKNILPITYMSMLIGSLSLIGFPFLSGFYSKDMILEISASSYTTAGFFTFFLGSLAAVFTTFYSCRLFFLVFLTKPNLNRSVFVQAAESSNFILISLITLTIPSIISGYFLKNLFVGFGTRFWQSSIFINWTHFNLIDFEFLPVLIKLIPFFSVCIGFVLFGIFYFTKFNMLNYISFFRFKSILIFFNRKWFFDKHQTIFISQWVTRLSLNCYAIDKFFYNIFISFFSISPKLMVFIQKIESPNNIFSFLILIWSMFLLGFIFVAHFSIFI